MTQQITILTVGSRGDVQPFIALGKGLQTVGYTVTIATHQAFEDFVCSHGIDFKPIAGDPREFLTMLATDKGGSSLWTFIKQLSRWASGFYDAFLRDTERVAQGADLLMCGFLGISVMSVAEKMDVPAVYVSAFPVYQPTTAFPPVTSPLIGLDVPIINWVSHRIELLGGYTTRGKLNHWRTETLGLEPYGWLHAYPFSAIKGKPITKFFPISKHFIQPPYDYPDTAHMTGYWFLDQADDWQPPDELAAFLNDGDAPIYVGFGSLIDRNGKQLIETVVDGVRRTGNRVILLGGWGEYDFAQSDDVFVVQEVPHDWLFPQMKAVVHHGGAGTTAAGLRAGVPTVVVPFFGDQPWWGHMVMKRGVGPEPISASKVSRARVEAAIHTATHDATMQAAARSLGEMIRAEDGVGNAIRVIQSLL